jgi:hypothetical protein
MDTTVTAPEQSGSKKKKIILIGIGALATGVLGYFGYEWYQKRKSKKEDEADSTDSGYLPSPPPKDHFKNKSTGSGSGSGSGSGVSSGSGSGSDSNTASDFPLKKGSRGPKVKALQKALIARYGKSIMPRYGADGDLGNETLAALKKAGLPSEIDESTYNVVIQGGATSSGLDSAAVAKSLYDAATSGSLTDVLAAMKQMQSVGDYGTVNKEFQQYRIGGVRETLVNGLLSSFSDESQKQQIRLEFLRIGLKYDGSKWSLSGLGESQIMTIEAAYVWEGPNKAIKVPKNMVLGTELEERSGYTLFENGGRHFLIQSKSIKSL